jgi:hypothetical protein
METFSGDPKPTCLGPESAPWRLVPLSRPKASLTLINPWSLGRVPMDCPRDTTRSSKYGFNLVVASIAENDALWTTPLVLRAFVPSTRARRATQMAAR